MDTDVALTDVSRHYRKTLVAAPIAGGVGLLLSALLGYPVAGAMFVAGLGLGLLNSRLLIGSASRYSASGDSRKRPLVFGALQRLAAITLVAFALAYIFRPEGLAVLAGLAAFQVIMMAGASGPLLREVRKG